MRSLLTLLIVALGAPAFAGGLHLKTEIPTERGGFVHPALLVGFNPQPEPPGHTFAANTRDPEWARVAMGQARAASAEIVLALAESTNAVEALLVPPGICGREGVTLYPARERFELGGRCANGRLLVDAVMADGTVLRLRIRVRGARGFEHPGAIVGFNPQPEPPGKGRFVHPASIVGFNPQPEPPGMPASVVLRLGFEADVDAIAVDVVAQDLATGEIVAWQ